MLLWCGGIEIRALYSRFGKSANLCTSCDALCSAPADTGECFVALGQNDAVKPLSYSNKVIIF